MSDFKAVEITDKRTQATLTEIRKLRDALPVIIAGQQALAEVTRARYLALIEQGFTPDQALTLCKT